MNLWLLWRNSHEVVIVSKQGLENPVSTAGRHGRNGNGSYYQFGVASLSGNQESAQEGARWLQEAMHVIGTGAKTAAGYGAWIVEPVPKSDQ